MVLHCLEKDHIFLYNSHGTASVLDNDSDMEEFHTCGNSVDCTAQGYSCGWECSYHSMYYMLEDVHQYHHIYHNQEEDNKVIA